MHWTAIIVAVVILLVIGLIAFLVARGTGQGLVTLSAQALTQKFGATAATPSTPDAAHP